MSKIKWDLGAAKYVADKAENDISAFPITLYECNRCGAVCVPFLEHDCGNTVEIEFHKSEEPA